MSGVLATKSKLLDSLSTKKKMKRRMRRNEVKRDLETEELNAASAKGT